MHTRAHACACHARFAAISALAPLQARCRASAPPMPCSAGSYIPAHIRLYEYQLANVFPYLQYLACLPSSSSSDKLAFDVGLQEELQGNEFTIRNDMNNIILYKC